MLYCSHTLYQISETLSASPEITDIGTLGYEANVTAFFCRSPYRTSYREMSTACNEFTSDDDGFSHRAARRQQMRGRKIKGGPKNWGTIKNNSAAWAKLESRLPSE